MPAKECSLPGTQGAESQQLALNVLNQILQLYVTSRLTPSLPFFFYSQILLLLLPTHCYIPEGYHINLEISGIKHLEYEADHKATNPLIILPAHSCGIKL